MDTPSIAELEQHAIMLRARIMEVAEDVKALLVEDLPKFVEREMKRAFISAPGFASSIDDARLRKLKASVSAASSEATADIMKALTLDDLWLPADATPDDSRKSMAENEPLWTAVSSICQAVTAVRSEYGFPAATQPIEYQPPTWFIGRRYLPSLSEKYWREVRELAQVQGQLGEISTEVSRADLSRRWDAV
ncbi:MAG: hypothetical protein ACI9WU_003611 [Myxococcota bacterium]|jgi:hypothetical protein